MITILQLVLVNVTIPSTMTRSAVTDLVQAVEQVTEAGPLQSRGWVKRVEAGREGVVALLQHSFQQG